MQLDDNEYLVDYHNAGSINKMLQHVALHHGDLKGIVHAGALNDHIDYQQLKDSDMERLQKDASYLLKHLYSALTEVYPDGGIRLMALTKGLMQKGNKKHRRSNWSKKLYRPKAPMW
jgi:enoyl-[acyl-carrier-protein] reductase (NADH)